MASYTLENLVIDFSRVEREKRDKLINYIIEKQLKIAAFRNGVFKTLTGCRC